MRRTLDDLLHGVLGIVVETEGDAEAVAQWRREHSEAGGRADDGEGGKCKPKGACARAFANHDVEGEVFHRGVEHFFDGSVQAVDFVDEEDFVGLEVGEDRGKVAWALDGRA